MNDDQISDTLDKASDLAVVSARISDTLISERTTFAACEIHTLGLALDGLARLLFDEDKKLVKAVLKDIVD